MLSFCGTASAQYGSSCGCSAPTYMGPPPIMRSAAAFFGAAAPVSMASYGSDVQCGAPINCHIETPVVQQQVVHVQAVAPVATVMAVQQLQPVHQPVMQTVQAMEMRPVKQMVTKPVVTTEYVDQAVTVMTPVSEVKVANVPTTHYQTVTEYKTVQKQVGYWVTQNIPTNKMAAYQYDNRPNVMGAMNRAVYNTKAAFTPNYQQVRKFVPQTMTCQVPCKKQVAVQGMKQVTYNVTRMQPTQTTRKVAVNKVSYQQQEVTVMAPHAVTKTVQVGTKISYVHPANVSSMASAASNNCNPTNNTALTPTPDAKASAANPKPAQNAMNPDNFNKNNTSGALEPYDNLNQRLGDASTSDKKFIAASKPETVPTAAKASVWVATRSSTKSSNPPSSGKSAAISIADSSR